MQKSKKTKEKRKKKKEKEKEKRKQYILIFTINVIQGSYKSMIRNPITQMIKSICTYHYMCMSVCTWLNEMTYKI